MNDDHSVDLRDSESSKRARTDFGTEAGLGSSSVTNKDSVSIKSIYYEHRRRLHLYVIRCFFSKVCHNFLSFNCHDATDSMI